MRFGTLLIGGILGAAAANYMNRGGAMRSIAGMTSNNGSKGRFAAEAADSFSENGNKKNSKQASSRSSRNETLNKLRDLLKEDPEVMAQVNEILVAGGEKPASRVRH